MPSLETLLVFAGAVVVFAVVPGPAVVYIVTRSASQGSVAGVVSALGVSAGTLVHVAAATVGLSALLASSAVAFTIVKFAGAAYLVVLGIRTIVARDAAERPEPAQPRALRRLFADGVAVAVLNPKTALFFLALLPQFVDPAAGSTAVQIGVLGLALVVIAAVSDSCWALLASRVGAWLRASTRRLRRQRLVTGGVYVALGVTAAAGGSSAD